MLKVNHTIFCYSLQFFNRSSRCLQQMLHHILVHKQRLSTYQHFISDKNYAGYLYSKTMDYKTTVYNYKVIQSYNALPIKTLKKYKLA